jgi:tRNA threonylcarbamoyladenosine biosynthesis protein TsaB
MPLILHIDTATQFCSVALSRDARVIAYRESNEKNAHSSVITVFVDEALKETGLGTKELDAVAVSIGPGSYTGLRIGVSAAKGLCYALDKPLLAVSTLQTMAAGMSKVFQSDSDTLFCPMIDARRMEVYCAIFDQNNNQVRETKAEVIDERFFQEELKSNIVVFAGDGAVKCKPHLDKHANAVFLDDFHSSAKFGVTLAEGKFLKMQFEDVAYFEPFYLKDFIAGMPKVKGLQ